MPGSERYAFGDFMLERSQRRVLRSDGTALGLTSRQFDALLLFVENAGQLLDKNTLMSALWPGLVVEENNLNQTVSGLRKALGDEPPGKRYIQTVARRGFRFIGPVAVDPPLPGTTAPASLRTASDEVANPAPPTASPDRRRWLQLSVAGAGAAVAGVAFWAWRRTATGSTGDAGASATLAVLPFKPLAAESRDELLEVGMADSLITRLSIVPGLVVRSVGSVRRYAGSEQDPVRAAQDLDVAWIVDGSLQRRGDQLRVTARLLRASDGSAAWSGSFDEKFTGVFDVQDAISARVMLALVGRLQASASAPTGTDPGGTRNTEAYELYLAASRHTQGRRAEGLRKSIALYGQAIAVDPSYALAHVGLAEALRETMLAADALPASVSEPARAAIQRALTLAPNLGEAVAEKGYSLYFFEFDWPGAEREFRRALSFNPNAAVAHFGLAQLLLTQDRPAEGFVHLRRARELDPMSPFFNTLEAGYLFASGRRAEAHVRLQRAFDISPEFFLALRTLATMQLAEGQPESAIALLRRAVAQAEGNSRPRAFLGMHLARLGHQDETREILDQLLKQAGTRYVPSFSLAVLYAALGEKANAFDALEKAFAARDPQIVFVKDDPRWSEVRQEPRFEALMRVMKLDRYGPGLSPS
jgi:TolB-like protein/DNA-binding winged helix-turn-helix (wHTH) protein/tetratricopeptide (TPR) repeat protein